MAYSDQEQAKRSFEALSAIVYRLKVSRSLTNITEIINKSCVSQPKMTIRNNEELRAQCRPSARDESRHSCHSADGAKIAGLLLLL